MRMIAIILLACVMLFEVPNANAVLKIDITQGNVEPLPIAINKFFTHEGVDSPLGNQIKEVVENDLRNSGLFKLISNEAFLETPTIDTVPNFTNWRQIEALAVSTGRIKESSGKFTVEFRLWDPNMETQLEGTSLTLTTKSWRRAAHKIADEIYKRLTGEEGYFDTRVLFIAESGPLIKRIKKLAIMDQDGANHKELTDGKYLVITPRFDPKMQRAIYMSYKSRIPQIFLLDINTGNQQHLGNFPGMSFAPRFSPDGNSAIMSIANEGTTEIYELNLGTRKLLKLTNSLGTINTSPSYSPDGKNIVFTSDRGGAPQLYTMNRDGSDVKRISFGEGSYSTPVWSPRGDYVAFTKQKEGQFYIGVIRADGSGERLLSSSWMDEGPTWSPNGRVIMFSRQKKDGTSKLFAVDVTGHNERLIETATDASDPAWSPILG